VLEEDLALLLASELATTDVGEAMLTVSVNYDRDDTCVSARQAALVDVECNCVSIAVPACHFISLHDFAVHFLSICLVSSLHEGCACVEDNPYQVDFVGRSPAHNHLYRSSCRSIKLFVWLYIILIRYQLSCIFTAAEKYQFENKRDIRHAFCLIVS